MNARHIVPLLIIAIASTGALIFTTGHPATEAGPHHEVVLAAHEDHHHDHAAIDEMLHYAVTHLGTAAAIPDSYVAIPDWNGSWELRWIDFHHGDHLVRVYHATHHDHPETRFVIAVDESEHAIVDHWTPVQ